MTFDFFMHNYIGGKAKWDIYVPCLQITTQKYYQFFFFHFNCILVQISHKKSFFINIFIPGRSGVNYGNNQCNLVNMMLLSKK